MVQKLILFREHSEDLYQTPSKIAKLFINRLVIDEEASYEHMTPFEFYTCNNKMADETNKEYEDERKLKGMIQIIPAYDISYII